MEEIPIYSPTKLRVLTLSMRRNDVPLQIIDWKILHLVANGIISLSMIIFTSSQYSLILLIQVLQFAVQILNMRTGPWGSKNGAVYCNVDEMIKSGQNSIRLIFTALVEAIVALILKDRFTAASVQLMYRLDGLRRSWELGEPTEQSQIAKDLESLHAAQPVKDPALSIDVVIPVAFAMLWYSSPIMLILFGIRAACIACRDFSIFSPIQEELYSDVVTTAVLNLVIIYIIYYI